MKYDFDKIIERKGSFSVKWDMPPAPYPKDSLPLWVADMDFQCAKPIVDALHKRVDELIYGYTYYDSTELKNTVTGWYKKRYEWDVPAEDIFFSPGVVPAVALLINILSEEGDGIVIQRPVYYPFTFKIEHNNRKVVNNPLIYKDGKYTMDYEDLERKLSAPENKGLVLCSPHNPVGRLWTEEELKKVIDIAKKYNKWIISDEIHADLIRKGLKFIPLSKIAGDYKDQIITCTAPSKTFNLAGFHMSNLVIHSEEYKKAYLDILNNKLSVGGVNPLGVSAMIAAYTEGEEWLDQVIDYIDANVDYCMDFFKKELPKSVPIYIEATYLFWVDLSAYCKDPKALEEKMVKAKVALDEGYIFGEEGIGFERINVACPRSILADCLNRMKDVLLEG